MRKHKITENQKRRWGGRYKLFSVILLTIFSAQVIYQALDKSPVYDEHHYVGAGCFLIETDNFNIDSMIAHPPLAMYLSSVFLPLLKIEPGIFNPKRLNYIERLKVYRYSVGSRLLFDSNRSADLIIFFSRLPILLISLLLAVYLYKWSNRLYGEKAALMAVFLYSFSPNIIAHSGLATTDMVMVVFTFIAVYYFWIFCKNPSPINILLSGLTFGLAQMTKLTALLLIPIYLILALLTFLLSRRGDQAREIGSEEETGKKKFRLKPGRFLSSILLIFFIGFMVVWAGYGFDTGVFTSVKADAPELIERLVPHDWPVLRNSALFLVEEFPLPLIRYLRAVEHIIYHQQVGHLAYLMGEHSHGGWWYYFIVAFLIKTPVPVLLLLFMSVIFYWKLRSKVVLDDFFVILPPLIFFAISFTYKANIGLRHILIVYPFLFLFISRIVNLKIAKGRMVLKIVLILFMIWYLWGTFSVAPHYLAYFNELIGGSRQGYRYLADSNLDWGQDLKGLKSYMDEHGIKKIKLSYFGTSPPRYYGIDYEELPHEPTEGWIAISATNLLGVYSPRGHYFDWLLEYEPVAGIGYSISVYHID